MQILYFVSQSACAIVPLEENYGHVDTVHPLRSSYFCWYSTLLLCNDESDGCGIATTVKPWNDLGCWPLNAVIGNIWLRYGGRALLTAYYARKTRCGSFYGRSCSFESTACLQGVSLFILLQSRHWSSDNKVSYRDGVYVSI